MRPGDADRATRIAAGGGKATCHERTLGSTQEDRDVEGVGTPALAIIGAGRAGSALAIAAHDAGYRVAAVASRRGEMAVRLADTVGAPAMAPPPEAGAPPRPH